MKPVCMIQDLRDFARGHEIREVTGAFNSEDGVVELILFLNDGRQITIEPQGFGLMIRGEQGA